MQEPVWSRVSLVFLVLVLEQPRQYINKCAEALKHYKQCLLQYFKFNLQVYSGTMSQLLLLCQNISQKRCGRRKAPSLFKIQIWVYSSSEMVGLGIPGEEDVPTVTAQGLPQGHPSLGSQDSHV